MKMFVVTFTLLYFIVLCLSFPVCDKQYKYIITYYVWARLVKDILYGFLIGTVNYQHYEVTEIPENKRLNKTAVHYRWFFTHISLLFCQKFTTNVFWLATCTFVDHTSLPVSSAYNGCNQNLHLEMWREEIYRRNTRASK